MSESKIAGRGFLGFLLEAVEHINCLSELGNVDDPVRPAFIANPNFSNAGTDVFHRLPVCRFFALLNSEQLLPGFTAGFLSKAAQIGTRTAAKLDRTNNSSMHDFA